jgi:hypothetical protein
LGPGESLLLWDNDTLDWVIGKMLWRRVVGIEDGFLSASLEMTVGDGPLGWVKVFAGAIRRVW